VSRRTVGRVTVIAAGVTLALTTASTTWAQPDPAGQKSHAHSRDHAPGDSQDGSEGGDSGDWQGPGRDPASARPAPSGTLIYYCDPDTIQPPRPLVLGLDAVFPQPGLDPTPPGPAPCVPEVPA